MKSVKMKSINKEIAIEMNEFIKIYCKLMSDYSEPTFFLVNNWKIIILCFENAFLYRNSYTNLKSKNS